MKTILILEDNDERIADFSKAIQCLGDEYEVKFWRDAPSMCAECEALFSTAGLTESFETWLPQKESGGQSGFYLPDLPLNKAEVQ